MSSHRPKVLVFHKGSLKTVWNLEIQGVSNDARAKTEPNYKGIENESQVLKNIYSGHLIKGDKSTKIDVHIIRHLVIQKRNENRHKYNNAKHAIRDHNHRITIVIVSHCKILC